MANFTQGSLSIEEYFSGFQTLWADYCDIVYANVPTTALSAVREVHATSKLDQFLMKLLPDFEIARSNMMNHHPIPSLDACLSKLFVRSSISLLRLPWNIGLPLVHLFLWLMQHRGDIRVETCVLSSALVVKLLAIFLRIVTRSSVTTARNRVISSLLVLFALKGSRVLLIMPPLLPLILLHCLLPRLLFLFLLLQP